MKIYEVLNHHFTVSNPTRLSSDNYWSFASLIKIFHLLVPEY